MVGFSHQVQIRHIVVAQKEVADLLKETIDESKDAQARVKMLMTLAGKYSLCASKNDGGNLGWLEMACDDPRHTEYNPVLKNVPLEKIIREAVQQDDLLQGVLYGPVETEEGFHLIMLCQQFGDENAQHFTGSSL